MKRQLHDAIKAYHQAISAVPYHVMARTALMNALRGLGKNVEADEQERLARELISEETDCNRAGFEAICRNTDMALEHLKIGLEKKQTTKAWAQLDPDFEILRDDPRFKALVE